MLGSCSGSTVREPGTPDPEPRTQNPELELELELEREHELSRENREG